MPANASRSLLFLTLLAAMPAAAQDVQWRPNYAAARREARQKGQPLALVFGTRECTWCKKLHETSLRDAEVVGLLNQEFIPLAVDGERDPALGIAVGLNGYPTIILAAPDGKFLRVLEGYQEAEDLHRELQQALVNTERIAALLHDLKEAETALAVPDPARALPLLRKVEASGLKHPAEAHASQLLAGLERKATARVEMALRWRREAKTAEAADALREVVRSYPGTAAARRAEQLLSPPRR